MAISGLLICFISIGLCEIEKSTVIFTDVTKTAGLEFKHHNAKSTDRHIFETMGSGACFLDYNNDGFLDIYLIQGGKPNTLDQNLSNQLYQNNTDGTFTNVTSRSGLGDRGCGMGVATGDFDNDGWTDIYVSNFGANILYRNQGDGTFKDVTKSAKVGNNDWSCSCAFFDYDLDGDLDLYVVNYIIYDKSSETCTNRKTGEVEYCHPRNFRPAKDILYRNDGDGTFTDVSKASGAYASIPCRGLGVAIADIDHNGYPDLYIANDTDQNFLYLNRKGQFRDIAFFSGTALNKEGVREGGMGVDIADYNGDGWPDIFVTNTETNTLYRSHGDGTFTDVSDESGLGGITANLVGFGTQFLDYDNDGDLDIFVTNGEVQDKIDRESGQSIYPQRDQLYRKNADNTYTEVSFDSGDYFSHQYVGRGAAFGDYDNDGDTDILVTNCNQKPVLLRNDGGNRKNWLSIKLVGQKSNRSAIGARALLTCNNRIQLAEVRSTASYLSSHDRRIIFGLDQNYHVYKLDIFWPSGIQQTRQNLPVNQLLKIVEPLEE